MTIAHSLSQARAEDQKRRLEKCSGVYARKAAEGTAADVRAERERAAREAAADEAAAARTAAQLASLTDIRTSLAAQVEEKTRATAAEVSATIAAAASAKAIVQQDTATRAAVDAARAMAAAQYKRDLERQIMHDVSVATAPDESPFEIAINSRFLNTLRARQFPPVELRSTG